MKNLEIGETVDYEGHILRAEKALETELCKGCYFFRPPLGKCLSVHNVIGDYNPRFREDGEMIIFKEVKEL